MDVYVLPLDILLEGIDRRRDEQIRRGIVEVSRLEDEFYVLLDYQSTTIRLDHMI